MISKKGTAKVLNGTVWCDAHGNLTAVKQMDEEWVRNLLNWIHKKRDWLLYNSEAETIRKYQDKGDAFFNEVIIRTVFWNALLDQLEFLSGSTEFILLHREREMA